MISSVPIVGADAQTLENSFCLRTDVTMDSVLLFKCITIRAQTLQVYNQVPPEKEACTSATRLLEIVCIDHYSALYSTFCYLGLHPYIKVGTVH